MQYSEHFLRHGCTGFLSMRERRVMGSSHPWLHIKSSTKSSKGIHSVIGSEPWLCPAPICVVAPSSRTFSKSTTLQIRSVAFLYCLRVSVSDFGISVMELRDGQLREQFFFGEILCDRSRRIPWNSGIFQHSGKFGTHKNIIITQPRYRRPILPYCSGTE